MRFKKKKKKVYKKTARSISTDLFIYFNIPTRSLFVHLETQNLCQSSQIVDTCGAHGFQKESVDSLDYRTVFQFTIFNELWLREDGCISGTCLHMAFSLHIRAYTWVFGWHSKLCSQTMIFGNTTEPMQWSSQNHACWSAVWGSNRYPILHFGLVPRTQRFLQIL